MRDAKSERSARVIKGDALKKSELRKCVLARSLVHCWGRSGLVFRQWQSRDGYIGLRTEDVRGLCAGEMVFLWSVSQRERSWEMA